MIIQIIMTESTSDLDMNKKTFVIQIKPINSLLSLVVIFQGELDRSIDRFSSWKTPRAPRPKNNHNHSPINFLLQPLAPRKKIFHAFSKSNGTPDRDSRQRKSRPGFELTLLGSSKRAPSPRGRGCRPQTSRAQVVRSSEWNVGGWVFSIQKAIKLEGWVFSIQKAICLWRHENGMWGVGLFDTKGYSAAPYYCGN